MTYILDKACLACQGEMYSHRPVSKRNPWQPLLNLLNNLSVRKALDSKFNSNSRLTLGFTLILTLTLGLTLATWVHVTCW